MSQTVKDILLLLARLVLGVVLIAHAWQKFDTWGMAGTQEAFAGMGVPLPDIAAWVAVLIEGVGGIAIIVGLATRVLGIVIALHLAAAIAIAHAGNGVFVADNGWELAAALGALGLALAAAGPGRISIDGPVSSRRRR